MSDTLDFLIERTRLYENATKTFLQQYEEKLSRVVSLIMNSHINVEWEDIYLIEETVNVAVVVANKVVLEEGDDAVSIALYTRIETLENGSATDIKDEHLIIQSAKERLPIEKFMELMASDESFNKIKESLSNHPKRVAEDEHKPLVTINAEQFNKLQTYVDIHGLNEDILQ